MLSPKMQREYERMLEEIARRVKAKEFISLYDLATQYDRTLSFAAHAKALLIKRNLITELEWTQGFTANRKRLNVWKCSNCGHVGNKTIEPKS